MTVAVELKTLAEGRTGIPGPKRPSEAAQVIRDDAEAIAVAESLAVAVLAHRVPAWKAYEAPRTDGAMFQIIQAAVDAGVSQAAIDDTIIFVRETSRPWIDSGLEPASDDPYTIQAVGDLTIRQHAAEALLDRAGDALDAAIAAPSAEPVAAAQLAVAEAKVLTTEIALAASHTLFELAGTRATLAAENLDRHWRNARTHMLPDPVLWKDAIVGNHALNGVNSPIHAWS